jgi:phosphate transport system protein
MQPTSHEPLANVVEHLVAMTEQVAIMIAEATASLMAADLQRAEATVSADKAVNHAQDEADETIIGLMTRASTYEGDMRSLVAALRITTDLERMGDLASHIAKVARRRYPDRAVPDDLVDTFAQLGSNCRTIAEKTGLMLDTRDLALCDEIFADDQHINELHRSLFYEVLSHDWSGTVEQAVDLTLLGRYYERFGDHAVLIAGHLRYLVTGTYVRAGAAPQR